MGRATQGVRLINIKDNDAIAAVAKVMKEEDVEDDVEINEIEVNGASEVNNTDSDSDTPTDKE
jgi:DNA gyrase subunit A